MKGWEDGRMERLVLTNISTVKSLWVLTKHISLMKCSSQIVHYFYNRFGLAVNSFKGVSIGSVEILLLSQYYFNFHFPWISFSYPNNLSNTTLVYCLCESSMYFNFFR